MNQVSYYRGLLRDSRRIEAFERAIHAIVKPGDVVLDVGTGLGTFAFFAADAGAARVWAVDGDPIVHVARTIARYNGYADRVTFRRGWLPDVTLAERANVIVIEDFSPRFLDARMFRLLHAVQRACAAPGARWLPRAVRFMAAPVGDATLWESVVGLPVDEQRHGIDWLPSRDYVVNLPHTVAIPAAALAGEAAAIGSCRLGDCSTYTLDGEAHWQPSGSQAVHGLALWFDLEMTDAEWLSNAPGGAGAWGHLFLPIDPPLEVSGQRRVSARVGVRSGPEGTPDALWWTVASDEEVRRGHEFHSAPASRDDVLVGSPAYVPTLTPLGRLESEVLSLVDGHRTVSQIAAALAAQQHTRVVGDPEQAIAGILRRRGRLAVERDGTQGATDDH